MCLTPGVRVDIDEWLGPMRQVLDVLEIGTYQFFCHRTDYTGPIWKITTDGFLENYHHNTVHRNTNLAITVGNLMVHDTFGPHQRLHFSRREIGELNDIPQDRWDRSTYEKYTRNNNYIFPNVTLSKMPGGFLGVVQIYPNEKLDGSLVRVATLSRKKPETAEEIALVDKFLEMGRQVMDEDFSMMFNIQKAMTSDCETPIAFDPLLIGRNEPAVQHYHDAVSRLSGVHNLG